VDEEELLELLEDELLEEELLEELVLDEEVELLDEELVEPVVELDELEEPPLELLTNEPAEAVRVTRSSREPSSRRLMRSVCVPAARLLKVAGVRAA
jgi:hypothetical protein